MAVPYSNNLRMKTVNAVKRGQKKSNVSRLFKISRNTLDLWIKREEKTGSIEATPRHPRKPRKII